MQSRESFFKENELDENNYLLFFNSIGLVFNDKLFFHFYHSKTPFYIDDIKSLKLIKFRFYQHNLFFWFTSFVLTLVIFFNYYVNEFKPIYWFTIFLNSAFLLLGIFYKKYHYAFHVNYNYNPILIKVDVKRKDDAKSFLKVASKLIKSKNKKSNHLLVI